MQSFRLYIKNIRHPQPLGATIQTMALFAVCILIQSCNKTSTDSATGSLPSVTVTIPPLEYFAKAIGGDSLTVTTLLPSGADPETFEPGINALRELNRSEALLTSGELPFEETLLTNLKANNPDIQIFPMSDGITLIYGTHSHEHHHETGNHSEPSEPDPHIWASVKNAKIIAGNMLRALCTLSPSHTGYFQSRHKALAAHLDSLDNDFQSRLANLPSRTFLIWHPSLSYFARDYGLTQIAFNIENKETSPLQLKRAINSAANGRPLAFFVPAGLSLQRSAVIAEASGTQPASVNLMSANWDDDMLAVAAALSEKQP